jgi:hypothetical protein
MTSPAEQDSLAQEVEVGSAVHLAFEGLLLDAALDYAAAVGQEEPVSDSGLVAADAMGEEAQAGNVGERRDMDGGGAQAGTCGS